MSANECIEQCLPMYVKRETETTEATLVGMDEAMAYLNSHACDLLLLAACLLLIKTIFEDRIA